MSATQYTKEDRRKRAAARALEQIAWARECLTEAEGALRVVVAENGHAPLAHDHAASQIDSAHTQIYDALSNVRCSR